MCFLTCYPQLLYSFVYKVPTLAETLGSITGLLSAARFLFSRDMIIAEVGSILYPILPVDCIPTSIKMSGCAVLSMLVAHGGVRSLLGGVSLVCTPPAGLLSCDSLAMLAKADLSTDTAAETMHSSC